MSSGAKKAVAKKSPSPPSKQSKSGRSRSRSRSDSTSSKSGARSRRASRSGSRVRGKSKSRSRSRSKSQSRSPPQAAAVYEDFLGLTDNDDEPPMYMVYVDEDGREQLVSDIMWKGSRWGYGAHPSIPYLHMTDPILRLHEHNLRYLTKEELAAIVETNETYEHDGLCHPGVPMDLYEAGDVHRLYYTHPAPGALPFPLELDD